MTTDLARNAKQVLIGAAFIGSVGRSAVAGQWTHIQLWNPLGSGKRLMITDIRAALTDAAGTIIMSDHDVALSDLGGNVPASKLGLFQSSAAGEFREQVNGATLGSQFGFIEAPLSTPVEVPLSDFPIILREFEGIVLRPDAANNGINALIQWQEF